MAVRTRCCDYSNQDSIKKIEFYAVKDKHNMEYQNMELLFKL